MITCDPVSAPSSRGSARVSGRVLMDARDRPYLVLVAMMALVQLPFAVLLYLPGAFRWWLGAAYVLLTLGCFLDRFILMLHNVSHRRVFRRDSDLGWFLRWVLGPLAGQTPGTYYAHHVGMHHPENNLEEDASSTLRYQRDSVLDFARYFVRFFFLGVPDLVRYLRAKGRKKLLRIAIVGELSYWAAVALLFALSWKATTVVFLVPFVVARFGMIAGNWAQHAFIDPDQPDNVFRNSITSINTRYNQRCFNDGYHTAHHLEPTRHWTELPERFTRRLERYRQEGALVFDGIDYFQIWALLMAKAYDRLADRVVPLSAEQRSREELISLLRRRTARIEAPSHG